MEIYNDPNKVAYVLCANEETYQIIRTHIESSETGQMASDYLTMRYDTAEQSDPSINHVLISANEYHDALLKAKGMCNHLTYNLYTCTCIVNMI